MSYTTDRLGSAARTTAYASVGFIGYVLAGYPAISVALGRVVSGPRPDRSAPLPRVSMIICAHNEAAVIADKLDNVAQMDYPHELLEVIVVDDGSDDGTADIARAHSYPAQVIGHYPRRGKVNAINAGVAKATADVLALSDAEAMWGPNALRELVSYLADDEVGAVNGTLVPNSGGDDVAAGEGAYWKYEKALKHGEAAVGSLTSILGAQLVVRRSVMPHIPSDIINDDFYIGMRVAKAGKRVAYCPTATTAERGANSLADDAVRRRRMTAGRWQTVSRWRDMLPVQRPVVMWQVVSHKYARLLLPVAMIGAGAGTAVTLGCGHTQRTSAIKALAFAQVAGYSLAAAAPHMESAPKPVKAAAKISRYMVRANFAALEGLRQHARGDAGANLWQRVSKEN